MWRAAAATPRKKLPPPTTRPICTPALATWATSSASACIRPASRPKEPSPAITSPLSFSRMRWYRGMRSPRTAEVPGAPTALLSAGFFGCRGVAHLEADETRHRDVFAELGDLGLDPIGNRSGIFLDERLFHQADFFVVLGQAAFDDFVENFLGLALTERTGARDVLLFFDGGGGHILAPHKLRIGGGYLHGQVLHQLLKGIGASDEIGFAIDFDQD